MKKDEVVTAVMRVIDQGTAGMNPMDKRNVLMEVSQQIDKKLLDVVFETPDDEHIHRDLEPEESIML